MLKNKMLNKSFAKVLVIILTLVFLTTNVYAIDGVYHNPYGIDDIYTIEATERSPRDPVAGENVYINITTWPIETGQATWITWTRNGVVQPDIGGVWKYNSGTNTYWQVSMGSFNKGDVISYTVHANKDGINEKTIGPFQFTVTGWEYITSISGYTDYGNRVVLNATANTGTFTPKINISFTADDVFRVQMTPSGNGAAATGLSNYTLANYTDYILLSTAKLKVKIQKNPYRLSVYKPDETTLIAQEYDGTINRNMAWLTNGSTIINKVEDHFYTPANEEFYGFGERYNNFRKRGQDVDTYVYEQTTYQNEKTYMAIPFFINTNGYGIYLNSTYHSKFRLATERTDMYSFTANTGGDSSSIIDYYFIYGNDMKDVISNFTDITEKPALPPKWAFGLWMSANEWDRQSEVAAAINNANTYNIPATAIVLEQWSDENTFYIFNDAQYTPKPGSDAFLYSDFTFPSTGRWPDPAGMVTNAHNNGMKVLLWQAPVQKYTSYPYQQKDNDEAYMVSQSYAVGNGSGGQYRIPWGKWFENSLLLDFTNINASNWWLSKRSYLFDSVGIDGFKTDGGEMVWGRWNTFSNGKKGDEMRNQYPNEYIRAYSDFARSKKPDAITFSRAGTTKVQKYHTFWAGDQVSDFPSYQQVLMAGLTANMSGVSSWGFDLAGFTGTFPTSELYKRSAQMAAFSPIMQFHSAAPDPATSEERSPWNVQSRTGDTTVIGTFAKYANTRMNLLPYIYSEAKKTSTSGIPLMRAMVLEAPTDTNTYGLTDQYMFGDNLLVAPIVNAGETNKSVYLPDTEWIDLWYNAQKPGAKTISYYAGVDTIPVLVKTGSIIPMNLNSSYDLGGTIGNSLSSYNTLTFRIYPYGTTSYDWYDDINLTTRTISSTEEYDLNKVTVSLPAIPVTSTLQVLTTKPASVKLGANAMLEYSTLAGLQSAADGWYYDSVKLLAYVKVASNVSARTITLEGVNKAPYEAEFATQSGVGTNTNHLGYNGTGFVDLFETQGDYVEFDVRAKTAGSYNVDFRYSSGTAAASRAIYVNGVKVTNLAMPKTTNWDTWGTVTLPLLLNEGSNKIKISFDQGNAEGINLDDIVVHSSNYVETLGNVTGFTTASDTLTLTIDNGIKPNDDILELKVCQDGILKVDYRPNGVTPSADTPVIDPNKTWGSVGATINTSGDPIIISTSKMRIEIAKSPARMTVKKADGTTLFWEPTSGGTYHNGIKFVRTSGQNLYGIRAYDFLEGSGNMLRNDTTHMIHAGEQGDGGAPLAWSTSGYGILLDADGAYPVIETATNKLEMYYGDYEKRRYTKTDVEYYILFGNPKELMAAVSEISGKAPMLPKWSMGFMNSEWGINQTDLTSYVDTYRAKNIPIDGYAMDYDWKSWGESNYGEFRWNTTNFPDAATTALKTTMDGKGIKMIAIMKPRIVVKTVDGITTTQAADATTNGYWYPYGSEYQDYFQPIPVRDIDFYNSGTRSWYWTHIQDAFNKGMVGFWNDEAGKTSAPPYEFWFGSFQGLHMQQSIYDGQRGYSNQRVWSINRNFYLGSQRYGYTTWSGDIGTYFTNSASDAGMQEQRERMLSTINLGQAKWGMDTGGFNPWSTDPSPELYSRWMQFSALTPVFRVHGNRYHQRQPWYYGTTAEEVTKSVIQMRYKLLPYIYASERSAYETGIGLVRPLIFDNPTDNNVKDYMDAWMFGDWMLAAPILDQTQTSKSIYLPSGTWIDYFRGNTYTGGQTIKYPVNAEIWTDIPMFIKKGAIIPSQKALDYVGQSNITTVFVDVFPDTTQSSFSYYDDDGTTYGYESGAYMKQVMTAQDNGVSGISFNIAAKTGSYIPALQNYIVQIHGKAGTGITVNGSALTSYADLNALKAASGEGWSVGKDVYGEVTYVKVAAASTAAKNIVVTGSTSSGLISYKYEAEEASLSGNTATTKATVNTNHTGYSGSGFVDGFNNADAATTFYANVKTGGDYSVDLRYANASGTAKTVSIFVNGSRVKQTSLASLANWDTWSTQTETLPLTAGNNIITYRYYNDAGDTGNVNLDYITVPFNANVEKYEAESAELTGGAATNKNHWYYTGAAFVDSFTATGAEAKFNVDVPSSGSYKVVLRYANGTGVTKTLSTYVNGIDVSQASFSSPGTDWNKWTDYEQTLTLNAGANTIAYKFDTSDSGGVNLDRILIASTTPSTPESEKNLLDNAGFDRPSGFSSNWTEWHPGTQTIAYGIDSGSGTNPPESPWTQEKRAYFYLSGAYQQSIHQVISVPTNNANYKFEAWVKMKNTTPTTGRAEITNYGGSALYYNITNDGVWKYISISNIYVTNGQVDVGFYVDSPGGTTLHIDDVRLTKQ